MKPTEKSTQGKGTLAELRPHITETRELQSGYSLLFADHPSPVLALMRLLSLEEPSCSSIKLEMGERAGDETSVWVHCTGGDCVKEFLRDELVEADGFGSHVGLTRSFGKES